MNRISMSRWKWVYFGLAVLDLIAVGSSLYVSHQLTEKFQASVRVNSLLARQLDNMEKLQILASHANAPGNDIFDSRDVEKERKRLKEAVEKFNHSYSLILNQLQSESENISFKKVLSKYSIIPLRMQDMLEETEKIYSYFEQNKKELADSRMATMDRKYASLRKALILCSQEIRKIQSDFLYQESEQGKKLRFFEIMFGIFIFLMVIGITCYGTVISRFITKAIQEKKMAEEQKKALDASAIVAVTDIKGKITHVNDKFCNITGYDRQELLGKDHKLINSGNHPKSFFEDLWRTISSGKIWRGEVKNRKKDGSHYWVDSTIVPIKNENDEISQYIAIRHEVTERKLLEERLVNAKEAAEEAVKTKSSFLANMSHEIRTPLNGILGMATLLSDEKLSIEGQKHLEIMKNSGSTLLALINDILDFSKIEAGKLVLENVSFEIENTVNELISLFDHKAKEKGLKINLEVDSNLPRYISADITRFRQVLTNLYGNALKFTDYGSVTIKIKSSSKKDRQHLIQCKVIDTGPGMPEDSIKNLFKSFSQVDASTTRKFGGTGLGLAICKGICEAMGGDISAESQLDVGSTFTFTFQAKESEPIKNQVFKSNQNFDMNLSEKFPYKILVADDHSTNQLLARKFLEKLGYKPDVVGNGVEVLHSLKTTTYDVIFMDGHMPELDGYKTTEKIHHIYGKEKAPWIIALTASATIEDQKKCKSFGMNDFVSKPFSISDLAHAIINVRKISEQKEILDLSPSVSSSKNSFDADPILKHFAGDEDIMLEVIQVFISSLPDFIQKIETAITNKNSRDLHVAAHTLKGTVSNFFVRDLCSALHELELMGKNHQMDDAKEKFKKVCTQLNELEQNLSTLKKHKRSA